MSARGRAWRAAVALVLVSALGAGPTRAQDASQAMVRFARGVLLLEQGLADQAIAPLSEAWRMSGHDPVVGARLAEAYYATRDVTRADQIAGEVLKANPTSLEMLHMKARLCLARGDIRGAIGFFERARAAAPGSLETERMLASLYAESGDVDQALACLERCIRIDPSLSDIRVSYGEMLLDAGEPGRAEAAFRDALEIDPTDARAVENLVGLCQSQGRNAEAIALLEAYAARPDSPLSATLRLAQAYLDARRLDDAARVLEERRRAGTTSDETELLLGRVYFEAGRYEDARGVFGALYKKTNTSPELARILGDLSLKTGDAKTAREYFEKAISLRPDDYRSYLALFFAQSEKFTRGGARIEMPAREAARLLERASTLAPRADFDAQFTLGMALSSVDSLQAARVHLSRARELEPRRQDALFNLASVNEKLGRYDDAERVLVDLYALAPDDPAVCNFYGYLLAVMDKNLDRAEELVRHALEKDPKNAYYIDSLGWVFYQRGEYDHAVAELERAVQIVGEDPVMLEHLGDAYSALKRFKDALAVYQHSSRLQEPSSKLREKIESTQRRLR